MKKTLYILSALLLGLVSCSKEMDFDAAKPAEVPQSGLVAVTMKVEIPVELQLRTRADDENVGNRSDKPSIKNMYVAVFGYSGYPQAYALAEPITSATDETPGSYANVDDRTFYFKVLLPVYEGEAHVHIIANGPETIPFVEQTEESIMTAMRTEGETGAYWARIIMPDGILTKVSTDGIMQTDDDGNFVPSEETAHLFEEVVLVRNFAEVELTSEATNLYDVTWTIVRAPSYGSVAPMAAGSYVDDYKNYTFDAATRRMINGSKIYNGYMFNDDPISALDEGTVETETIPTPEQITTPLSSPAFVFERPAPNSHATCILVKARFGSATNPFSYYRLDMMDDKGYFPLYRNFKYKVKIHKVGNKGASTPSEAMNRDSGGNVSQTLEAQSLTDISDGSSRLFVEYVEKNFVKGGVKTRGFNLQYIPNVLADEDHDDFADVDNTNVTLTVKEGGTALKAGTTVTLNEDDSDVHGYYFYDFELNNPDPNVDLETVLEIKADNGVTGEDHSVLYRTVTIRVLKQMEMELSLEPPKVDALGDHTVLTISLPDNLPSSMFPLEFHIEDVNHTLNPTQEDGSGNAITVPVKTAKSIADGETNSFYFIRTVNYDDYVASHDVCTEFQTIHGTSVTTIYVENEYFDTESIVLLNDGIFVSPTKFNVPYDQTSVEIDVLVYDQTKTWTVTAGSGVTVSPASGTGTGKFTMTFDENTDVQSTVNRTARVTCGTEFVDVTIVQDYLRFAVTPATQTVAFNATSATIKVSAPEEDTWTVTAPEGATVSIGDGVAAQSVQGTGVQDVTVHFEANTGSERTFSIGVVHDASGNEKTVSVTQRTAPNSSMAFVPSSFGYSTSNRSATANSTDGYVSISLGNLGNAGSATRDGYVQMGYRQGGDFFGNTYQGTIQVTPSAGFKITQIKVTYSSATSAGYDFSSSGDAVTVTPGTYTRDSNNSATATWRGSTTGTISFENGYWHQTFQGYNFAYITKIEVFYEAI